MRRLSSWSFRRPHLAGKGRYACIFIYEMIGRRNGEWMKEKYHSSEDEMEERDVYIYIHIYMNIPSPQVEILRYDCLLRLFIFEYAAMA